MANENLHLSNTGAGLIKHFESCLRPVGDKFQAYYDPIRVLTIGWGHTNHHGRQIKAGDKWTREECDAEFLRDMELFEDTVKHLVKVPLKQYQFDALVSFAFNCGGGNLKSSTLLRLINANAFDAAAREFPKWNKAGGKVLKGLVRRRASEALLFQATIDGDYDGKADPRPIKSSVEVPIHRPDAPPVLLPELPKLAADTAAIVLQTRLIDMGLLDPPPDGVAGSVTRWALQAAGIKDELTVANMNKIGRQLSEIEMLPLQPGGDLAGRIVRAAELAGYWIARHKDCCNIFYIEGLDEDGTANANKPNRFNDLRVVIKCTAAGVPKIAGAWQATTEPSRYWTLKPMNSKGAARIAFGQWKAWSVGIHNGSHEALVQTSPLTVWRDKNKDFSRVGDEQDEGLFGINQHWGYDLPKDDLGRSSAGCLVGRMKAGHREFMALIKQDARFKATKGSYKFMSTIMPAALITKEKTS